MQTVKILCIGSLKESYWRAASAEYLKRLGGYVSMSVIELPESKPGSGKTTERIIGEEGAQILRRIDPRDEVIALCVEGKPMDSVAFSKIFPAAAIGGKNTVFVIGGSDGLSEEVKRRASRRLSFSPMTLPHQLMRVVLLEQIYRACKINAGETYHK